MDFIEYSRKILKIQFKNKAMELRKAINSNTTVKELLDDYPHVGKVFVKEGLLCAGCPTESFHTLADVAREYQLDLKHFIKRIEGEI